MTPTPIREIKKLRIVSVIVYACHCMYVFLVMCVMIVSHFLFVCVFVP